MQTTTRRALHVGRVLARHGLGATRDAVRPRRGAVRAAAVHLRLALEELGPAFIKLGQVLSTRPDLLPDAFEEELSRLQDRAPVVPWTEVRATIEAELGVTVAAAFTAVDETPLASASIGQVHAATADDGRAVVVKVRRPGVAERIELDLAVLLRAARVLVRVVPLARRYDAVGIAEEFASTLRGELDYLREGANAERIAAALADVPRVRVPAVVWPRTTVAVLTEERITGVKIDDVVAISRAGIDRSAIAVDFADAYLAMVFRHGFFHADPHPGNVFVDDDGTVGFVDFGMVGAVAPELTRGLGTVLVAVVGRDARAMADALLDLGVATDGVDRPRLERDLGRLLDRYAHCALAELPIAEVLAAVMAVVRRHRLTLPADLALLVKTVMMCEGVALRLDPGFVLVPLLLPFAAEAVAAPPPDAPPHAAGADA